MALTILSIILLCGPLIFELADDAHGDQNKGMDVSIRIAIGLLASFVAWFTDGRSFLAAFNLSMAIHWMFFDYLLNWILHSSGFYGYKAWNNCRSRFVLIISHVGKSGVIDNLKFWKEMNPYVKLGIRVAYFIVAVTLYFVI